MAGLLSRFTTFLPNTTILSNDHNQELNRIVNLLNGTTTNLKTVLKTSDAGDPPLELDQLGAGPILELFQGGILKAHFRNDGALNTPAIRDANDNEQLIFVPTGSAVNEFTMTNAAAAGRPKLSATGGDTNIGIDISPKGTGQVFITGSSPLRLPTGVTPSNDDDAARKKYIDDKRIFFSISWFIFDPSTFPVADAAQLPVFIVPDIASGFITKFKIIRFGGSHTGGTSVEFRLFQAATEKTTVSFNDTNSANFTQYTSDFTDSAVSADQAIWIDIKSRSGVVAERSVTISLEGYQTPKTV